MALVYCINIHCCPLFNTFYSKGVSNVKRFISRNGFNNSLKSESGKKMSNKSFKDMIDCRLLQARKSILVRLNWPGAVDKLCDTCTRLGPIANIFSYSTVDHQHFVLMEFKNCETLKGLKNYLKLQTRSPDSLNIISPILMYKGEKLNEGNLSQKVFDYSAFTVPQEKTIVEILKPLQTMEEQMISLYYALKFSEIDIRLRFYTAEVLTFYLTRLFTNIVVLPFGSSVNGFGQTGCDLDLVCTINHETSAHRFKYYSRNWNFDTREKYQQFLETACVLLHTGVPTISSIKKILNARVPILKFSINNTNMKCDLCGPNITALHMSKLLYIFSELDYRVRPLVHTIRKWAQVHNITKEQPGQWITNFSLTLLVIFYLQIQKILPPIIRFKRIVDNLNNRNSTSDIQWSSINDMSLDQTLIGFFQFYHNFDFKMHGICIRNGEMKKKLDADAAVYIYNPFVESLNVSKNINQLELARLRHHFHDALQLLTDNEDHAVLRLLKYTATSSNRSIGNKQNIINEHSVKQEQTALVEVLKLDKPEKVKEIIK